MPGLATQPTQEDADEHLGVEPVGLRPAMFARYRHARGMNNVGLNAPRPQPTRQPEAIPPGFEGQDHARHTPAGSCRLISPFLHKPQQRCWIWFQLLQRPPFNAGDNRRRQPTRLTHFKHGDQSAMLFEGYERIPQIIHLAHGSASTCFRTPAKMPEPAVDPIASRARSSRPAGRSGSLS